MDNFVNCDSYKRFLYSTDITVQFLVCKYKYYLISYYFCQNLVTMHGG
jgi:hypothetical protein